jgi:hypothetical protein
MIIRIVIACHNANGEPDFAFVKVCCDEEDIIKGIHYDVAEGWAENNAYEGPFVCFDESDIALGPKFLLNHFVWESASIIG